jgi:aspartate kinase
VGYTNYDIADQLADVGMEAIHPKASKPLEMAGIHLRIKNTFEPEHLLLIDIYDPLMVGNVNIQFLIVREDFKKAIVALNKEVGQRL